MTAPAATALTVLNRHPLLLVVVMAAVVRLPSVMSADFPLGDGGLFAQMSLDLRANGFSPPPQVSYYGSPWIYPPLPLYVLAAIPGEPSDTLRWLPPLLSIVAACTVWLLARDLLGDRFALIAASTYSIFAVAAISVMAGGARSRRRIDLRNPCRLGDCPS